MSVLPLGSIRFVGRHLVTEYLARDDDMAVVYRVRSPSPSMNLHRDAGLRPLGAHPGARAALAKPWHAVIDTWFTDPDERRR